MYRDFCHVRLFMLYNKEVCFTFIPNLPDGLALHASPAMRQSPAMLQCVLGAGSNVLIVRVRLLNVQNCD